jgi:hypothetical protein
MQDLELLSQSALSGAALSQRSGPTRISKQPQISPFKH